MGMGVGRAFWTEGVLGIKIYREKRVKYIRVGLRTIWGLQKKS